MNVQTNEATNKNKKEIAYEYIIGKIRSGEFAAGAPLPSIPKLVVDLGQSQHTIQRAMELLEAEGFISRRKGAGCFVLHPEGLVLTEEQDRANQNLIEALTACRETGMTKREIAFTLDSIINQKET